MKHDIFGWFVLVFLGSVVLVQATTRGTTTRTKTAATCTTSRYSRQEQYGLSGWVYSSIVRHRGGSSTLPTTETQNSNPNSNTQLDHQPLVVNTTSTNNIDDHRHHHGDIHKNGTTTIDTHDNSQLLLLLPKWKQTLPLSLQSRKTLHRILIPNGIQARTSITKNSNSIRQEEPQQSYIELYILGTSHVSNDSSTDVKTLLQHIKPNVVFLELCSQRIGMLESTSSSSKSSQNDEEKATATNDHQKEEEQKMSLWQRAAHLQSNSEGMLTRGSAMGTTLLTKVQDGYAESLGVELGSEFRVAYQWCYNTTVQAQQQQQHPPAKPLHLILGDRPLQLTLLRAWESLRFWGKLKVLGGLLINCLWQEKPEEIRAWMNKILEGDSDVLTESIAEMAKHFPTLERVIIQERDAYMAAKLYQTCRLLPTGHNVTLVAIVGAGHCPGICQWLTNGNGKSPEEILSQIISTKKHPISELQSVIHDVTELPIVVP